MQIGHSQSLTVVERHRESLLLGDENGNRVSLPLSEAALAAPGDTLRVFVYTDAAGQPLATTEIPLVECGQCASLKVVDITHAGAFLDWGLSKNLLLPFAEQRRPLEIGRHESVLVYRDNSGRLAASSRLDHHLPEVAQDFRPWQAVSLLLFQRTDLGLKAVVDHRAIGLLYKDEIFQDVRVGQTHQGFVKRLRHDGRIDLSLQPRSRELQPELTETIVDALQAGGGSLALSDSSSPEAIQSAFQVSKKNFKKALSTLYKQRRIVIHEDHISLAAPSSPSSAAPGPGSSSRPARDRTTARHRSSGHHQRHAAGDGGQRDKVVTGKGKHGHSRRRASDDARRGVDTASEKDKPAPRAHGRSAKPASKKSAAARRRPRPGSDER